LFHKRDGKKPFFFTKISESYQESLKLFFKFLDKLKGSVRTAKKMLKPKVLLVPGEDTPAQKPPLVSTEDQTQERFIFSSYFLFLLFILSVHSHFCIFS